MHHIHHTTAFVISHVVTREADRYITLFTRELGVIRANAQGIRKISSKLRFSLQDFSYARVDLVQGKNIWRITSAKKIETHQIKTPDRLVIFARILELVKRLCPGEEPEQSVFEIVETILTIFSTEELITKEEIIGFEYIAVVKILSELGYVAPEGIIAVYLLADLSSEKAREAYADRKEILSVINTALGETQL